MSKAVRWRMHRIMHLGAAMAVVAAITIAPGTHAVAATPRPWTIPALKQWTPRAGSFTFTTASRVVIDSPVLTETGREFAADLTSLMGHHVELVSGSARKHDLVLRREPGFRPAAEGYQLDVGATAVIEGATVTGVFWGTRTMLQLLHQSHAVPGGVAHDWPSYPYRGIALCNCSSSPYFSVQWLEGLIREMSYLKYNVLHLNMTVTSRAHPENNPTSGPRYSTAEARALVAFGQRYHVQVAQQVSSPGHMTENTNFDAHPALHVKNADGVASSADLDISKPAALRYIEGLDDEQMSIFPAKQWYGGGDEFLTAGQPPSAYDDYPSLVRWARAKVGPKAPAADSWILWQNQVAAYVESKKRTLHVWNDQYFTGMPTRLDPRIVIDYWTWYPHRVTPAQVVANGNDIVNVSDALYYTDVTPSAEWIYQTFAPNLFSAGLTPAIPARPGDQSGQTIPANNPHLLGAAMAIWPDPNTQSEEDIGKGLDGPIQALAQKIWDSAPPRTSYKAFVPIMNSIGHAPGYPEQGPVQPGRSYTLHNVAGGNYVTAAPLHGQTGRIVSGPSDRAADQRWRLTEDRYGHYALVSAATGKCATAPSHYASGTAIMTATCDAEQPAQQWLIERSGNNFLVSSASSSKVLTVNDGTIVQRYSTGASVELWKLARANGSSATTRSLSSRLVDPTGAWLWLMIAAILVIALATLYWLSSRRTRPRPVPHAEQTHNDSS